MHQNTTNYNSNAHFELLELSGGASRGQKSNMAKAWFFWSKVCGLLGKTPYIYPRYQVWGVVSLLQIAVYGEIPHVRVLVRCLGAGVQSDFGLWRLCLSFRNAQQMSLQQTNMTFLILPFQAFNHYLVCTLIMEITMNVMHINYIHIYRSISKNMSCSFVC